MGLSKKELLAKSGDARRFEDVAIPSGGTVRMRSLKRSEQRAWRQSWITKGEVNHKRLAFSDDALLAMCLVDESGEPLFTTQEAFDGCFDGLDAADANAMLRVATALSGLGGDDPKKVDDAIKNSDATPGKDSSGVSADSKD